MRERCWFWKKSEIGIFQIWIRNEKEWMKTKNKPTMKKELNNFADWMRLQISLFFLALQAWKEKKKSGRNQSNPSYFNYSKQLSYSSGKAAMSQY